MKLLFLLLSLVALVQCSHSPPTNKTPAGPARTRDRPTRLVILVFDHMRPDYVDRFNLYHFKKARVQSVNFTNAIVGHLSASTAISHHVIGTGLLPKHLLWSDRLFRDTPGKLGKKNALYRIGNLSMEQWMRLLASPGTDASLVSAVTRRHGGRSFAVAQERQAALALGGKSANTIVTLGPIRNQEPFKGWRTPTGVNVPAYFNKPQGNRFYLDCWSPLGSHKTLCPLDGTRFVPGSDPSHTGGDRWTADALLTLMDKNSDWTVALGSFGSIDKISQMLAEHNTPTMLSWALEQKFDLKNTLARADFELGRILNYLEDKNLDQETLLVVTSGHGGQANEHLHGVDEPNAGMRNRYFGKGANFKFLSPPPTLAPVLATDAIAASVHDSALRFWLKRRGRLELSNFAAATRNLPGVAEVYTKRKAGKTQYYVRTYRSPALQGHALQWATEHNQNLADSMASSGSADVLALLLDGHGYSVHGEYGGAQEAVQRIPLFIRSPNLKSGISSKTPVRLVDINPMIRYAMGLSSQKNSDGESTAIEGYMVH